MSAPVSAARAGAVAALARSGAASGAASGDALAALERLAALLGVAGAALFCPPSARPAEPAPALLPCLLAGVAALLPDALAGRLSLPEGGALEEGAYIAPGVL